MDRRTFLTRGALVTAPLVAGCSGQQGDGGGSPTVTDTETPTDTRTPTATQTATETPTASEPTTTGTPTAGQQAYPGYEWGRLSGVEPEPTTTIRMANTEFHPLVAEVTSGTGLTVTNEDVARHTITVPALDVDETVDSGASVSFTVQQTGTFDYVCTFHPPRMLGRLVVTAAEQPTTTSTATDTPTETATPTPVPDDDGGY
ncbi:cupredoxin domain-containing protein [Halomicroarcula sp. F13]|uniref:Cupredoxin domain-containing protein n=1 Tax=Haloarcula rubra TaxID=2487747 RepID=A0AAW4PY24_9EURY|nr:cupredoxin domain-containing protein [Halomicroarcula rubra]MBX0325410.1 cupredoxin domain-containing protein [Halomicroarcula rubra]